MTDTNETTQEPEVNETTPEAETPKPNLVNMRCRKCGHNQMGEYYEANGVRVYQCPSCATTLSAPVGGSFGTWIG